MKCKLAWAYKTTIVTKIIWRKCQNATQGPALIICKKQKKKERKKERKKEKKKERKKENYRRIYTAS